MKIIMKEENKESIYDLVYDEESIKSLISEIIKNCSIRKKSKSYVEAKTFAEAVYKITSATNGNGDKIHENIEDITEEPVNDPDGYWRIGDPVPYSFTSDVLLSPELAKFLINILNGKTINYEWFDSRKELTKKQELQQEIQTLDAQIDGISNFETKRKIDKLEELAKKVSDLANIPEFNYDLLTKYYDIAEECIQLDLVQETVKYQKKSTPKKYPRNKQD